MPIYEFKCAECAKIAEFSLKMSDPHPVECPACHKPALAKMISPTAFVLKGSGWYKDAYTPKKPEPAKKADSESGAGAETGAKKDAAADAGATPPSTVAKSETGAASPPAPAAAKKDA